MGDDVAEDEETTSPSLEVPQESAITTSISSKLEQLVQESNVYTATVKGKRDSIFNDRLLGLGFSTYVVSWIPTSYRGNKFAKTKIENLFVKAYGLCHEDVLRELKTIATSDVNSGTLFYDDDHITPWHPGMYLKYYWKSWCNTFPALANSLEHNFGSMFSTTTVLEQSFSTYNSKADANATGVSNCAIIRHHINSTMELTKETVEDAALILTGDSLAGICITQ